MCHESWPPPALTVAPLLDSTAHRDEFAASVLGFSAASYKRFDSYEAAKAFALPGALGALNWFLKMTVYEHDWNQTSLSTNMTESLLQVRSRPTLLSGVPFFSNPALDRIATDVLEGLIITLALVAAIVLVLV